jgi:hypothetical protein
MIIIKHLLTLFCVCVVTACAQSSAVSESAAASSTSAPADKPNFGDASASLPTAQASATAQPGAAEVRPDTASAPAVPAPIDNVQDTTRLDALYRSRTRGESVADYPIGPGDIVQISVPPIDELRERTVRVEADGSVSLPMLGLLQAGGLTEK